MTKADDQETRLRIQARLHDGVIPVPFIGTTWRTRGGSYWRRRAGAVLVFLLALALVGIVATGFTIGIAGGGHNAARVVAAIVYDLTAVLGIRAGLRRIAAAPLDERTGGPGTHVPSALIALVLAPFGTGLVLTMLVAMFGRDFLGEDRARRLSTR
jgi:hypothetical protein